MLFVGDDWAEAHHDIEIQDESGRRLTRRRLPEGIAGIGELHDLIGRFAGENDEPGQVVIGIETDRGPWVTALVAAGYTVYAANPKQVTRYRVTVVDGVEASREVLATAVTVPPVTEQVTVGTKPRPEVAPTADGLNWAALAKCESGGNPRAVNNSGPGYYGLYQFAVSTWRSVGGSGNPVDASPDEQTARAKMLYNRSGAGQWPACGPNLFR